MMRFLRFVSLLLMAFGCACRTPYADLLTPANGDFGSALRFKPVFNRQIYRTNLEGNFLLKHFHLSGLLFLKMLPDSSTRVVFQNEMGYTFFDFGWTKSDSFIVYSVIPQLDRKAIIKTLQKDFEALLLMRMNEGSERTFQRNKAPVYRFPFGKGYIYYSMRGNRHRRNRSGLYDIIITGRRKIVVSIFLYDKDAAADLPDQFTIEHWGLTHGMTIMNTSIHDFDTTSDAQ